MVLMPYAEIHRLQNSIEHLQRTQLELREYLEEESGQSEGVIGQLSRGESAAEGTEVEQDGAKGLFSNTLGQDAGSEIGGKEAGHEVEDDGNEEIRVAIGENDETM